MGKVSRLFAGPFDDIAVTLKQAVDVCHKRRNLNRVARHLQPFFMLPPGGHIAAQVIQRLQHRSDLHQCPDDSDHRHDRKSPSEIALQACFFFPEVLKR